MGFRFNWVYKTLTLAFTLGFYSPSLFAWGIFSQSDNDFSYKSKLNFVYPSCALKYLGVSSLDYSAYGEEDLLKAAASPSHSDYLRCHEELMDLHRLTVDFVDLVYDVVPAKRRLNDPLLLNRLGRSEADDKLTVGVSNKYEYKIPDGFEVSTLYKKCESGFAAIKITPTHSAENLCVFSIAGTNEALDAATDRGVGKGQVKGGAQREMIKDIVKCAERGSRVLVTGHSLGGLMAQFFAYRAQEILIKNNINNNIEVVTWNAPGTIDLVDTDNKEHLSDEHLSPLPEDRVYQSLDQVHYNLDGDIVSTYGKQIGLVVELNQGIHIRFVKWHLLDAIREVTTEDPKMLKSEIETTESMNTLRRVLIEDPSDRLAHRNAQETEKRKQIREELQSLKTNSNNPMCAALPDVVVDLHLTNSSARVKAYEEGFFARKD
ncbi:MAG: hypothetical protein KDD50_06510 [Bdellovibrionales bacterium]|nr:hypothetical protein [Bdellovibrionales bacterium]